MFWAFTQVGTAAPYDELEAAAESLATDFTHVERQLRSELRSAYATLRKPVPAWLQAL